MGFVIFFIICIIGFIVSTLAVEKDKEDNPQKYGIITRNREELKLYPVINGKYLGGIDDIGITCNAHLVGASTDELTVRMELDFVESGELEFKIPYSDVRAMSMKTEKQMSSDVTCTRLLLMGVFAFGAKKKTIVEDVYFVIKYTNSESKEQTIMISTPNNQIIHNNFKKINGLYYNYKNGSSKVEVII